MPRLIVNNQEFEAETGERLVLAIARLGFAIGHRCGGVGECATCRVQFLEGEPDVMTEAEYNELVEANLLGKARLSCQIEVDREMSVKVIETAQNHPEWHGDPGPEVGELVEPEAVWYPINDLKSWE